MYRIAHACLCFVAVAVLTGSLFAESSYFPATRVDGQAFSASLSRIEKESAEFEFESSKQTVPLKNLLWWGKLAPPPRRQAIELTDGSRLVAAPAWTREGSIRYKDATLTLKQSLLNEVIIPRSQVSRVWVEASRDQELFTSIRTEVNDYRGDEDRIWLVTGDAFSGTLDSIAEGKLTLNVAGDPLEFSLSEVAAVRVLSEAESATGNDSARIAVGLHDGTLLLAGELSVSQDSVNVKTAAGLELTGTRSETITYLQPLGGTVQYLSDLQPLDYRYTPFITSPGLSVSWDLRTDRNLFGEPLAASGQYWLKGLAVHGASRLVYRLPTEAQRFSCQIALDDSSRQSDAGGSAIFRVYLAREGKLEQAYESPIVRTGDAPLPVSIDLAGGKAIVLLVDYAERGDQLDHADWLNAHFVLSSN